MTRDYRTPIFLALLREYSIPAPVEEYRFHPTRKWRFDMAWPNLKLAVEVDGGGWVRGRHHTASGSMKDNEKMNTAVSMGWRVLRFTPKQIETTEAVELIWETAAQARQTEAA